VVVDRLSPRSLAFLTDETPTAPRHNATLDLLRPGEGGFDHTALVGLVAERLSFVPRYRQRVQTVPGRLATPVWVDDDHFDLEYHVRRSALPRPGTEEQLLDLVARIVSRPLDRTRPLWEVYVIEGLADGSVALLAKTHQALVDGVETVDLGQLLLDARPDARSLGVDVWSPRPASGPALLLGALLDTLTDRGTLQLTARATGGFLARRAAGLVQLTTGLAQLATGRRAERETPLSGRLSEQRLIVTLEGALDDFRRIRQAHGGTVNDAVLAVVAGGLRGWLMTRAESLGGHRHLRALVPVSVIDDDLEATALGSQIAPHYVELPIGEPSAVVRLHQVSYSFATHEEAGRAVAAVRLAGITGARVAAQEAPHGFALAITNVPGPQSPRYAAGAALVASYPVHPLLPDHALAIGVTSYDGKVFFGITADRDLVPDAETLGQCLREALEELLDTATGGRRQAPRGRKPTKES
jgi:diacylglycerol O-acyltransferase / wax synthase